MSLIELKIDRIQYSETQTGAYILFLKQPNTNKNIPIIIGGIEAHSIAIGLEEDIKPQRPLTHDLMKTLMDLHHIKLNKIIINKYDQGIFYAMIVTEQNGNEILIDSRTSDAVALAVRFKVPIFCESSIIEEVSITATQNDEIEKKKEQMAEKELEDFLRELENDNDENAKEEETDLSEIEKILLDLFDSTSNIFNKKEIEQMLNDAIESEQYERAAKLKQLLDLM